MNETGQNNQNAEFEPEMQNSEYSSGQYVEGQQGYYENPYYGGRQDYGNGQQYYGQNADYNSQQYYGQNADYNSQQYYGQNADYNSQQYYGQNADYNSGQYYGQNAGYYNGQYYGQNAGYHNGQHYGQNAGYDNQQYYGQSAGYHNGQYYGQPPYGNPQYAYGQYQIVREPVTNVFYYMLMALTAASAIVGIIAAAGLIGNVLSSMDLRAVTGQDYVSLYSSMMYYFVNSPSYSAYSVWSSVLGFAAFTVSIIDIIQVHKKRYPILGLVLFSILCKPGYFIWRAHVLKQKKLIPILFVVSYVLLYVGYFFWCLSYVMLSVMQI